MPYSSIFCLHVLLMLMQSFLLDRKNMHVTCHARHDEAKRKPPSFFPSLRRAPREYSSAVLYVGEQNSSSTWIFDSYDSIRLVESFEDTGLRKDGFMMTSGEFSDVVLFNVDRKDRRKII